MTHFRWRTASLGTLPISVFGRAARQAAQTRFVTFSSSTAVSCLPSSQGRANEDEMGYVSAVLHLEPWTSFLLFFGWFPVLVPSPFLFSRHPRCRSGVQVFVRLQLSESYTCSALRCPAKRRLRNPSWTTPVWQREVFLLLRPEVGRGFVSGAVACPCQKNTPIRVLLPRSHLH